MYYVKNKISINDSLNRRVVGGCFQYYIESLNGRYVKFSRYYIKGEHSQLGFRYILRSLKCHKKN